MMPSNINDHTSILGMGKIYSMGDVDSGVDPHAVEEDFIKNYLGVKEQTNYSASDAYQNNLKQLESYSMNSYNDPNSGLHLDQRSVVGTPSKNFMPPSVINNRTPAHESTHSNRYQPVSPERERTMEQIRYGAPSKTEDERVSHALHEMLGNNNHIGIPIIPLVTEDDKEELLEDCISLREELKDTGVNISNIIEPHSGMSKEELERIYKRLLIKNNKKRAGTTAEELFMLVAKGAGKVFNGQTEWFGYRLDARGWDATVKGKMKRMRYDCSNWISGIMKEYTMSSGTRIGIELVPSFLLCLATNKGDDAGNATAKPSYSDKEWENSIADIADTE